MKSTRTAYDVFGEWVPLIGEEYFTKYRNMLMQATVNGIPIEPNPALTFHCLRFLQPDDVKVVILGQDPYPDGKATGLAFANDIIQDAPELMSPSLRVIRESVLSLSKLEDFATFDPSLESWEKQGILLLNSALTVKRGEPGSHTLAWKPFIERLLVGISAHTNAYFLLFGKTAWSFKDCIFDNARGVAMEYHPAYYARNNIPMPNACWKEMLRYVEENFGTTLHLYGRKCENQECNSRDCPGWNPDEIQA